MSPCLICQRIADIKANQNPFFVQELETGYVVLCDFQLFKGYTIFISKEHVSELHELESGTRDKFLHEMSLVAEAVYQAFKPQKLNYELLGNTDRHLHWHLIPRYGTDPVPTMPIWSLEKTVLTAEENKPTETELTAMKTALLEKLEAI